MSEETTQNMPEADGRSFEERVPMTPSQSGNKRSRKLWTRAGNYRSALTASKLSRMKRALICERPKILLKSLSQCSNHASIDEKRAPALNDRDSLPFVSNQLLNLFFNNCLKPPALR